MRAYVLINAKPGKVRDIVTAVARLEGVRHADAGWGMPDIFVEAQAADEKGLSGLVIDRIQKLEGVERTETHAVVE
jgi:DNA-binding Lrp family transcriptional regulator